MQVGMNQHVRIPFLSRIFFIVVDAVSVPGYGTVTEQLYARRAFDELGQLIPNLNLLETGRAC
jgi:hypothetical protein